MGLRVDSKYATRLRLTFLALMVFLFGFSRPASALKPQQLDLQKDLCDSASQQQNNDPLAGVDFLSEDQVVVYTVCNLGEPTLARRDDPKAPSLYHLKAIILDVTKGTVQQRFEWPTRGRNSMVRVTHAGDLLSVRDNLLEVVNAGGKSLAMVRIPKVSDSDMTFVGLSPATDTVVVTQSSERPDGKTVNGVAVLDSKTLDPIAQFHDDGDSWNIAATRTMVVRTSGSGTRVQVRGLKDGDLAKTDWKTVWPHSSTSIPRPLFRNDSEFVFPSGNSLQLFTVTGKALDRTDCINAVKAAVSRNGKLLAAACIPERADERAVFAGSRRVVTIQPAVDDSLRGDDRSNVITIDVYAGLPLGRVSGNFRTWVEPGFDLALSPSGTRLAVVDRLGLRVFQVQ